MCWHQQILLILAMSAGLGPPASAHDYKLGLLDVAHPWTRATPAIVKLGAGYLMIRNRGAQPDRLIGGSSPAADRLELHQSTEADGIARMRRVDEGLEIPAGRSVELSPGGTHLMFVNLKQTMRAGEQLSATLVFEKAGAVAVEFLVQPLGAPPAAQDHESH